MATATYYASVRESTVAANKRHLQIFNDVGSGKVVTVFRIVAAGTPTAVVAGLTVPLAAIRITTAPTDGTTMAFAKAKTSNAAVPAQITARTASTTGTVEAIAFGVGAVTGEETASATEVLYEAPIDGSEAIVLAEGEGFEVRQLTLASAGAVSIVAVIGLT